MTLDRRGFLAACTGAGVSSALFPGVLYTLAAQAQEPADTDQSKPPKITPEMIDQAAILAGIGPFTDEQKKMMMDGLVDQEGSYKAIRKLKLPNSVAPTFVFHPMPAAKPLQEQKVAQEINDGYRPWPSSPERPQRLDDLAFASVTEVG